MQRGRAPGLFSREILPQWNELASKCDKAACFPAEKQR
jgi:hypothetical protein